MPSSPSAPRIPSSSSSLPNVLVHESKYLPGSGCCAPWPSRRGKPTRRPEYFRKGSDRFTTYTRPQHTESLITPFCDADSANVKKVYGMRELTYLDQNAILIANHHTTASPSIAMLPPPPFQLHCCFPNLGIHGYPGKASCSPW